MYALSIVLYPIEFRTPHIFISELLGSFNRIVRLIGFISCYIYVLLRILFFSIEIQFRQLIIFVIVCLMDKHTRISFVSIGIENPILLKLSR